MTTQAIRNRFEKNNYKIVIDFTGVWVITPPFGFKKSFQSLTAAYRHYFQ